jgi:hypothetical protein
MLEPIGRGVLDHPLSRVMTTEHVARMPQLAEREEIALLNVQGHSLREIGRRRAISLEQLGLSVGRLGPHAKQIS